MEVIVKGFIKSRTSNKKGRWEDKEEAENVGSEHECEQ
jgi:hypothetical protein